ncbi:Polynucleotide 5 -hydroxyl-kinase NOL9 [Babesia ovata]|uniref:Polynucleotide 5-hydroxyl-kinase NOL9 n=1 Tax=Babesia ovata TaxID=189622 RepID=A0A2H6KFQ7_9APIC|nr:Polynucleotide 5 -hydroxyl-kinase NOL9 [Babesia ovata]GBE61828.1 Polynucleotide 5 -hydroxyl-kinase NOL9 [Babesia ovata]
MLALCRSTDSDHSEADAAVPNQCTHCGKCTDILAEYFIGGTCCAVRARLQEDGALTERHFNIAAADRRGTHAKPDPDCGALDYYNEQQPNYGTYATVVALIPHTSAFGTVDFRRLLAPLRSPKIVVPGVIEAARELLNVCARGERAPVLMLHGDKSAGKSTAVVYIVNYLLNHLDTVALLDTDVGQPIFAPPGTISLKFVTETINAPPHALLAGQRPDVVYLLGDVKVTRPEMLLRHVHRCFEIYTNAVEDDRSVPLIINTFGWISGMGAKILEGIAGIAKTSVMLKLNLKHPNSVSLYPVSTHGELESAIRNSLNVESDPSETAENAQNQAVTMYKKVVEECGAMLPWDKTGSVVIEALSHSIAKSLAIEMVEQFRGNYREYPYCGLSAWQHLRRGRGETKADPTPNDLRWLRACAMINPTFGDAMHFPQLHQEEFFGAVKTTAFRRYVRYPKLFHSPKQLRIMAEKYTFVVQINTPLEKMEEVCPAVAGSIIALCRGKCDNVFSNEIGGDWEFITYVYVHYLNAEDMTMLVSHSAIDDPAQICRANIAVLCQTVGLEVVPTRLCPMAKLRSIEGDAERMDVLWKSRELSTSQVGVHLDTADARSLCPSEETASYTWSTHKEPETRLEIRVKTSKDTVKNRGRTRGVSSQRPVTMEGVTLGDSPRMASPLHREKAADTQRSLHENSATSLPDSPIVLGKPADELALVLRTVEQDPDRRETHLEEPQFRRKATDNRCYIPNGLSSQLFMPLWMAVFRHKKLQKKTVVATDVERLCIALLCASKAEDRPFLTVGCHVKGLCIILSHKLEFLAEDCNQLSKKLLMSTAVLAIAARPKQRKSYREGDEDYQLPKRKRQSAKTRKQKKQMLALEDYFETGYKARNDVYDEYSDSVHTEEGGDMGNPERHDIAVDQIEVLQLMNFGIGLGMGTDLAFYSADSPNRGRDISYHNFEHGLMARHRPSLESLQQRRETINPDTFLDLQSLSSPFKLNGYAYTPRNRFSQDASDADTTIASTELTLQSESVTLSTPDFGRYDLDWDIYNDPFENEQEERDQQSVSNESRIGAELVPTINRTRRMVLEHAEPNGKPVHLVKSKSVARYDTKVTSRTPKTPRKVRIAKEQTTLDTFAVSAQPICDKTQWFNSAIDSLVRSVMGCMPEAGEAGVQKPDSEARGKESSAALPVVKPPSTKQGDRWFKNVEREVSKAKRVQSPRHAFDSEMVSTVQLIEGFRTCVRQREDASEPIQLEEVLQGRSKESAALLFYRTLVLANAQFVALSQPAVPGAAIAVTPARRFWEPIQTSRDLKA